MSQNEEILSVKGVSSIQQYQTFHVRLCGEAKMYFV